MCNKAAMLVGNRTLVVIENGELVEMNRFDNVKELKDELANLNHRGVISPKRYQHLSEQVDRHAEPTMRNR